MKGKPWLAAAVFGVLLGAAYPPVPFGMTAFVAFVPLLALLEVTTDRTRLYQYCYFGLFIFNFIGLYWTGGFVHAKDPYLMTAGAMLLIAHPLFYLFPVWMFRQIARRVRFDRAIWVFPLCWVTFEYLHSLTQMAFPWLLVGNTQTYDLEAIQFASVTGVYGVSLWVLYINVVLYAVLSGVWKGKWKFADRRAVAGLGFALVAFAAPHWYGSSVMPSGPQPAPSDPVRVGVVQPNIDPFEKWTTATDPQLDILKSMTVKLAPLHADLAVWPETAVPYYLREPVYGRELAGIRRLVDSLDLPLLSGAPDLIRLPAPSGKEADTAGKPVVQTFNACMLLQPHSADIPVYSKMMLVPFAERVPYSEALEFLNAAKWNFGLGGWNRGTEQKVFTLRRTGKPDVAFSSMICYESVFPGFVSGFVRKGARFLVVITNDSWWGNTSGAYQHARYGVLRAIENRRWLVQASNGGISCVIDPFGNMKEASEMYKKDILVGSINPESAVTTYTKFGDWCPQGCLAITVIALVASWFSRKLLRRTSL